MFLHINVCCGYSLELPSQGDFNEYPQHVFLRIILDNIPLIIIKSVCLNWATSCSVTEATL